MSLTLIAASVALATTLTSGWVEPVPSIEFAADVAKISLHTKDRAYQTVVRPILLYG